MTPTTPTPALAELDLDKLEALAKATKNGRPSSDVNLMMAMDAETTLALIALARRAAQPVAPVQATESEADEYAENLRLMHVAPSPQIAEVAELPPLPEPKYCADDLADIFTTEQMQQYARDAIAASRRAAGGEVAAALREAKWRFENILERGPSAPTVSDATKGIVVIDAALATPAPASAGQAKTGCNGMVFEGHPYCVGPCADCDLARKIGVRATQPAEGAGQAGQVAMPENALRVVRRLLDGSQPKDIAGAIMVIDTALAGGEK